MVSVLQWCRVAVLLCWLLPHVILCLQCYKDHSVDKRLKGLAWVVLVTMRDGWDMGDKQDEDQTVLAWPYGSLLVSLSLSVLVGHKDSSCSWSFLKGLCASLSLHLLSLVKEVCCRQEFICESNVESLPESSSSDSHDGSLMAVAAPR